MTKVFTYFQLVDSQPLFIHIHRHSLPFAHDPYLKYGSKDGRSVMVDKNRWFDFQGLSGRRFWR